MKTTLPFSVAGPLGLATLLALAAKPAWSQAPTPNGKQMVAARPASQPPANATPAQLQDYERQRWNFFLTDSAWRATRFNAQPNALLVETVRGLRPGAALDMGAGEGRNAIYLAQQGWQVTGVDIAEKALAFAQARAHTLGVPLTIVVHDAETYDWGTNKWDLIVLSYAGGREYAKQVKKALKSGGLLVLEGFHTDAVKTSGRPIGSGVVFGPDELKNLYAGTGFQIVRYEEPMGVADFSKENLRLVKLVARKP